MALTERSRHRLFESFTILVDDEQAVEEMLSYFPARDVEEPVTKEFLRAELQTEIGQLRAEMHQNLRSMHTWFVGMGVSLGGLILAAARFV